MTGFYTWLKQQQTKPTPIGDLARDVASDSHWPRGKGTTLHDCRNYLESLDPDAIPEVFVSLERAWWAWSHPDEAFECDTRLPTTDEAYTQSNNPGLFAGGGLMTPTGICNRYP